MGKTWYAVPICSNFVGLRYVRSRSGWRKHDLACIVIPSYQKKTFCFVGMSVLPPAVHGGLDICLHRNKDVNNDETFINAWRRRRSGRNGQQKVSWPQCARPGAVFDPTEISIHAIWDFINTWEWKTQT